MTRPARLTVGSLSVAVLGALAVTVPQVGHADPTQPGTGDDFFINYVQNEFSGVRLSAIRASIPLAHQVCAARANGQDDLQAARLVSSANGVQTLGVSTGSTIGDESVALQIVDAATLAYCPTYNNGNY
ncbi:MAG TPA: DUF732 domain-containing protein [Mycobacterium sp.]|jgi:hypothetical protein|nr:DUF732 domain-containing protein [Mycobacterium sp.]HXO50513.1 DUF732 domain-containing protein [Mycobacterium sp.]